MLAWRGPATKLRHPSPVLCLQHIEIGRASTQSIERAKSMNLGGIRFWGHQSLPAVLLLALGLSLCRALPASAQSSCNGLPATIVGAAPGVINGTAGDDVIVGTAGADQIFGFGGADVIC